MIEPGQMRHLITIQSATLSQSTATGESVSTWGDYLANRWAKVTNIGVTEFEGDQQQINQTIRKQFDIYYPSTSYSVTMNMRIVDASSQIYNIVGIENHREEGVFMTLIGERAT